MEWVWIIVGIFVVGVIADNPWILAVIAAVAACLVIYFLCSNTRKTNNGNGTAKESDIDSDFVREAVLFLNGYLSLCSKHSVMGHAYVSAAESNEVGINADIGCRLFVIDGEHAVDALWSIPNVWHKQMLRSLDESYDAYKASEAAFEGHIKEYFGCSDLHYTCTDPEEYKFNDPDVVISFERQFFSSQGSWMPTLEAIKQELLNKWPDAHIQVNSNSIIVD